MKRDVFMGLARHALTALGGALVASGHGDEQIITETIGVILAAIGLVWSIAAKHQSPPPTYFNPNSDL